MPYILIEITSLCSFSFTCTRSSSIGLNMDAFYKAVRIAGNEDSVRINIAEQASTGELEKQVNILVDARATHTINFSYYRYI